MLLIDAADWYVPLITSRFSSVSTRCTMVDLGATNVAKTAPRTNRVAATAKISVLVDEIGLDERIVVRGGLVLYIVVSMLIVGIACAAIGRCVLPLEVAWRAHLASRNARLRRNYSGGRAARA